MATSSPIHVVCRTDGVWQVERENGLAPLSLHADAEHAVGAACALARREHRGLAIHRRPRRPGRPIDAATWGLIRGGHAPDSGRRPAG